MISHSTFLLLDLTATIFSFTSGDMLYTPIFLCLATLLKCVQTQAITSVYSSQTATSTDTQYDQNAASCYLMDAMSSSCAVTTPDFYSSTAFAYQASCLCYTPSTIYAPLAYDGYVNGCIDYLRTAAPSAYISIVDGTGPIETAPCSSIGDVRAIPTTSDAGSVIASTQTSSSSAPTINSAAGSSACAQLESQYSACTSSFPGTAWATLVFTQQASCLCYTSTTLFAPTFYDNTHALCISYLSIFSSAEYSRFYGNSAVPTNLCSAYGNVRVTTTTTTDTTDVGRTPALSTAGTNANLLSPLLPTSTTRQNTAHVLKVCTPMIAPVLYLR